MWSSGHYLGLSHFKHGGIGISQSFLAQTSCLAVHVDGRFARAAQIVIPDLLSDSLHLRRIGQLLEVLAFDPEVDVLFAELFLEEIL